jgi:metal-sulfur cluster biosynthetic enzyme
MLTKERIIEELETIYDPEINLDIYTLGLIRHIIIHEDTIDITMTYTTVACPAGPLIQQEIRDALLTLDGVKRVNIEVTFDPPWKPPTNLRQMMGV